MGGENIALAHRLFGFRHPLPACSHTIISLATFSMASDMNRVERDRTDDGCATVNTSQRLPLFVSRNISLIYSSRALLLRRRADRNIQVSFDAYAAKELPFPARQRPTGYHSEPVKPFRTSSLNVLCFHSSDIVYDLSASLRNTERRYHDP